MYRRGWCAWPSCTYNDTNATHTCALVRDSVTPHETRVLYIYAYTSLRDIHYNSEREPYNMMHLWYANRGQNITLRRRRDSSLPGRWRHPRIPTRIPPTLTFHVGPIVRYNVHTVEIIGEFAFAFNVFPIDEECKKIQSTEVKKSRRIKGKTRRKSTVYLWYVYMRGTAAERKKRKMLHTCLRSYGVYRRIGCYEIRGGHGCYSRKILQLS